MAELTTSTLSTTTDPDILTFDEARSMLRIGRQLCWQLANTGQLPGFRVGRCWRFRRSSLLAWMESRERSARKGVRE